MTTLFITVSGATIPLDRLATRRLYCHCAKLQTTGYKLTTSSPWDRKCSSDFHTVPHLTCFMKRNAAHHLPETREQLRHLHWLLQAHTFTCVMSICCTKVRSIDALEPEGHITVQFLQHRKHTASPLTKQRLMLFKETRATATVRIISTTQTLISLCAPSEETVNVMAGGVHSPCALNGLLCRRPT
jgi:hypothetical protein